ncbi:polyhydroxyalkanoate synthesis regulator phasin [Alkalibacillus salilacus]|uniref:Polyhydroxyalkanoate synthesis regulator phasin n=1 Tax=Alkalibacillus salilacus TaxID=284582 RepID=A0ABT9VIM0_9BACI|nr:polyhydroxyalkanoate synthesis regulator phasin [Alkalibacillus salilacus]
MNAQNVIEQQNISDQNTISSNEERINELEALIENGQLNEEEEKRFEQEITLLEEAVNKAEMRLSGFENDDWEQVLSTFIENDQKLIEQEKQLNGNTQLIEACSHWKVI